MLDKILSRLNIIDDERDCLRFIEDVSSRSGVRVVSFLNAHAINLAFDDESNIVSFLDADYLLRDGVGIEMMCRVLGVSPGINMNGTDLIPRLLKNNTDKTLAVLGTCEPWLGKACSELESEGLQVVFSCHGFEDESHYVQMLRDAKPEMVLLGMGMPKQEALSVAIRSGIDFPCLVINGGAIIDFLGGRYARAPKIIRAAKMEWVFRLMNEPKRLFYRYVVGNLKFIYRVLTSK